MKTKLHSLFSGLALLAGVHEAAGLAATNTPAAIPWNQIGAKAGADYQGDGRPVAMGELFRRRKDEQFFRRSKVLRAKLRCVDFLPDAARQMRARASCQDRIDFQLLNSTRNLRISKNSCFDSAR